MTIRHDPFPEYRSVICAECGEDALVYHSSARIGTIAGLMQECEYCGTDGKVVLLDDEGREWLEFRAEPRDITCVSKD